MARAMSTQAGAGAKRAPTPEQRAAIVAAGSVFLEAGAGTGKTGVMVERYCRLTCEEGVSPNEILAFTFTDKAASELRQRIRAELAGRAEQGSEKARELLGEIGGAWITTIHGFCNRLLARHPVAIGADPRFRVLDAPETERAAREAFDRALEDFLADPTAGETPGREGTSADGSADTAYREETVAAFGIEVLRGIVVETYAELRSRGFAQPALPETPPPDIDAAIAHAIQVTKETLAELKPTYAKRGMLEDALEVLSGGDELGLDDLAALRTETNAKPLAQFREAIDAAVARKAEAGIGGETYRHLDILLALFSARFKAAKARRAGIDFEDLQILAASLLEEAEIGEAYRSRFKHLMVDEFQDTNRLQLRLIEALRGPECKLMVVGDEFQSIYGFRHADLEVFREQRRAMGERRGAKTMELSGNFRSRPEVIGAVNALAGKLLGDSFRPLRVGAVPAEPLAKGTAVELLLTAREDWDGEGIDLEPATDSSTPLKNLAEARFLALRLRALADEGTPPGDMVVLLRAFTHLGAYEDSLERAGLRPYVVGGQGYWSQQQVADVCALLATIANPLDDQALFGALASPACGLAPDTLWLLRAAAGEKRHVWPAVALAAGLEEPEVATPERLAQIPGSELELLGNFAGTIATLRERGTRLSLPGLVEEAVSRTGYDLAVLMRPAGEARFANVRKLMRIAAEFEAREGRDLRGLLDFLAARAEADMEAEAATSVEGHDGVRIMTIHNAKGLEFGVVAVPGLSRGLLDGSVMPPLTLGRKEEPQAGLQLRRLGARSINLYSYADLCEERKRLDAEEALRLFYVAATRARDRLILSGVVKPETGREEKPSKPVIERIVDAFEIDRTQDSLISVPPPLPRKGLKASFAPVEIEVKVNLPSPAQAAELVGRRRDEDVSRPLGEGPVPLVVRRPPSVPRRPLSYTAISAYRECAYRFHMERVLGLGSDRKAGGGEDGPSAREERSAHGAAVHALLEWSQINGWAEPDEELALRHARAVGLDKAAPSELIEPVRGWLSSSFFGERVAPAGTAVRAEEQVLLGIADTVIRGSIDLLVEREGSPPLVIDYKTDRLGGDSPAERAARYETQRSIYALAVSEYRKAPEVEVAYVFLERPHEPAVSLFTATDTETAKRNLAEAIERIGQGDFPPAPPEDRNWSLCRGCPAVGRMCSGPREAESPSSPSPEAEASPL